MTSKVGESGGPPPDQRRYQRLNLPDNTRAILKDAAGNEVDVGVMDLSGGGAGLSTDIPFDNNAFVELHIDGMAPISGKVARKFVEGMGVEFDLSEREKSAMEDEVREFRLTIARENR